MNIIKLENIRKVYGEKNNETVAIESVNLTITRGDFIAIMGASGSGKSTLLNIIGCMDAPTSGNYYLNGINTNNLSDKELSKIRNSTISFVFQHFALMKDYSVYDNVELPLIFRNIPKRKKKNIVMGLLNTLAIQDQVKKKPPQLSGGQQQRVAIARALASDAEIILADEPTGSLDQKTGTELMELLVSINNTGKTIIVVTHDEKVASYCKRRIIISDGKLIQNSITNIAL